MLRLLIKVLAYCALLIAVITAVLDLAQSIADSTVVMKPLGTAWLEFSQNTLNRTQAFVVSFVHPYIWDPIIQTILRAPSWAVFGGLWLLLSISTYRRKSRFEGYN